MKCGCFSGKELQDCCGPILSGEKLAETPEELMRSRYSAYAQVKIGYIKETMRAPADEGFNAVGTRKWAAMTADISLSDLHSNQ